MKKCMLAVLLSLDGEYGYTIEKFATSVGRMPGNDLIIPNDSLVSKQHAFILNNNDGFWIQDLGSKNGTYINGSKLEPWHVLQLHTGDEITVGMSRLSFSIQTVSVKGSVTTWDIDPISGDFEESPFHSQEVVASDIVA